ncbi:hypothetical protein PTW32_08290 [Dechloromonas agitata]|uniref:hypothetical protein n=1 Tax=Dechloromonas agitata TaxID=73030 RepID=UPI00237D36F2|nr:hypothetical protein [Dechloromonas agitata]MDE1545417.1 hypothetical protein [Dechloromonas agitata]
MTLKTAVAFTLVLATTLLPLSASSFTIAPSTANTSQNSKTTQPQLPTESASTNNAPQKKELQAEKPNQLSTTTDNKSGKK